MFSPMLRIAAAVLTLAVAACNAPPWTVSQSPDAITLRWYSDEMDISSPQTVADRHCGSTGRTAALTSNEQSGSVQLAEFRCR